MLKNKRHAGAFRSVLKLDSVVEKKGHASLSTSGHALLARRGKAGRRQVRTNETQRCVDFGFGETVQQQRSLKASLLEQAQVVSVIKKSFSGGEVPRFSVVVKVLGMGNDYVRAEQLDGFAENLAHLRERSFWKEICAIKNDFEMRRLHFIKKSAAFLSRIDDIADFRLEAKGDVELFGNGERLAQ